MSKPTVHASAVLVGAKAVLITGPSGSGKSRLVADLLRAAQTGTIPFARLVADDRVLLEASRGQLLVRPAAALAGLLEVRGVGIQPHPHESMAVVGLVVRLGDLDAQRLPETAEITVAGIKLPLLVLPPDVYPLPAVLVRLGTLNTGN
jgi:serine kinase of HPr protein (carbohydrate metabolism regulator)